MRGPRKIDGTLQIDPENVRIIRGYMVGSGSAKDAVYVDLDTTDRGLYYFGASNNDTEIKKATLAGVALEDWDCDADNDGTDDTEQIIKIQVLGPVTDVNVASGVAKGEKLVATSTDGQLDDTDTIVGATVNQAAVQGILQYSVVGIAYTAEADNKAGVYLLNPLGL